MEGNPCPQYPVPGITQEALDILTANMSEGIREVQYADKKIVYHSLADMQKLWTWMYSVLNPCSNYGRGQRVAMSYKSGLRSPRGLAEETEEIKFRNW